MTILGFGILNLPSTMICIEKFRKIRKNFIYDSLSRKAHVAWIDLNAFCSFWVVWTYAKILTFYFWIIFYVEFIVDFNKVLRNITTCFLFILYI